MTNTQTELNNVDVKLRLMMLKNPYIIVMDGKYNRLHASTFFFDLLYYCSEPFYQTLLDVWSFISGIMSRQGL